MMLLGLNLWTLRHRTADCTLTLFLEAPMRLSSIALAVLATTLACSKGPGVPAPLRSPAGMYDFTTEVEGQAVSGTVEIAGTEGSYSGWIRTSISDPLPIRSVTIAHDTMTVVAQSPDAPVTMIFTFQGNDFVANWEYAGQVGVARGSKRTPGGS